MAGRLDFLVVGAQKCATSWLYYCLREHPELQLPAKKREVEYLGGDLYEARGADWYFGLLGQPSEAKKLGDVSVEYIYDPRAPGAVREHAPNVKFILSMRDPIDRVISAYHWVLRKGVIPDLPLEEGINRAMNADSAEGNPGVKMQYRDIIHRGYYDVQMERYLGHFDLDRFLFVLYEDISEKPMAVLRRIYEFIGVNPDFEPPSLNERPKHNTYLRPLISLERIIPRSRALGKVMDIANKWSHRLGIESRKPDLSGATTDGLRALYRPHVEQTQRILERVSRERRPLTPDLRKAWSRTWGRV